MVWGARAGLLPVRQPEVSLDQGPGSKRDRAESREASKAGGGGPGPGWGVGLGDGQRSVRMGGPESAGGLARGGVGSSGVCVRECAC